MKTQLFQSISDVINKIGFGLQKHSPEICVIGGVVGLIGAGIWACVSTTKLDPILKKHEDELRELKADIDTFHLEDEGVNCKKEIAKVYVHTGLQFVKLYAPPIALAAVSTGSILTSHGIMKRRNLALATAVSTVTKSFKEYRKRVVDKFGEEVDTELRYGVREVEVEEEIEDAKGKKKTVKKKVKAADANLSDFAVLFDKNSCEYSGNQERDLTFLAIQERYFNQRLIATGHLFMNEVFDDLGLPRTKTGQVLGWIYDPEDVNHPGDNYVKLGARVIKQETIKDGIRAFENVIVIDPNVDGDILNSNKIERVLK